MKVKTSIVNMRLPEFYVKGVEILQTQLAANGLVGVSRTQIIKEALSDVFKKYDIKTEEIEKQL